MKMTDCNWTHTHNHLVGKQTLNHLAKLRMLYIGITILIYFISGTLTWQVL